jgi:hypothetical protein
MREPSNDRNRIVDKLVELCQPWSGAAMIVLVPVTPTAASDPADLAP